MSRVIYDRPTELGGSIIQENGYLSVTKKASLKDQILLSPIVKFVLPTVIAVACLMTAVYLTMYFVLNDADDPWPATCNIRASYRIECFPGRTNISYDKCNEADCCWHDQENLCFHSIPSRHGYKPKNQIDSWSENEVLIPRRIHSPFGKKNAPSLALEIRKYPDLNHIEIVMKIGQSTTRTKRSIHERRETFVNSISSKNILTRGFKTEEQSDKLLDFLPKNSGRKIMNLQDDAESKMDVYVHTPEFSVTVTRKNGESSDPLMSTARGPLILTEHYWELTLYVTNSSLYGLNQLELNGTTNWIYDNENGTMRPAFLGINDNGDATSCYLSHEGPMEIKVINESNLVVVRGFSLPNEISIHVFAGPTPLEAIGQLTKALREENEPPDNVESLINGLHICPNDDLNKPIESLTTIIEAMRKNQAPWDSHCIHRSFDPTLGNFMDEEKNLIVKNAIALLNNEIGEERTLVPHLSPMIFADNNTLALELAKGSLLLNNSMGTEGYMGSHLNRSVVYPDWRETKSHNVSMDYLNDYMKNFQSSKLLYLRDSWPRDETTGHPVPDNSIFDYMPRDLQVLMTNVTVPYNLVTSSRMKFHYTEHNVYSSEFHKFVRKRRESTSLVLRVLGGEVGNSSWSALREIIRVGIGSGLVGQLPPPMYACGTGDELPPGDNNDELCSRWYGAAVAWPHVLALHTNLPGGRHLTETSSTYVTNHLKLRASLLTYAKTILAQHYTEGSSILAQTSIHYPKDLQSRRARDQFMWGYGILVGLVTLPKVSQVPMWIPDKYPWRHLNGGVQVNPTNEGITWITAAEGQIVTLIRPGYIIPLHKETSMTTALTIKSPLSLVTNLACDNLINCRADGKIFYGSTINEGEFLTVSADLTTLKLGNILKVNVAACSNDGTNDLRQGTIIKNIILLGYDDYNIDKDLCTINDDAFSINFTQIT